MPRTNESVSYTHLDVYKRQVIDQRITKADERCSQTEREVHSFQSEFNTKVTDIEEKQKEEREEWEKVQNRFTEKCDGIEAVSYTHLDVYKRQL